jgi:hypothetical protein
MAHLEKLTVSVEFLPLLHGEVKLPLVNVQRPNVALYRDATGRANWDFTRPDAKPAPPLKLPMPKRWTKMVFGPIEPSMSRSDWSKPRIIAVMPTIDVMPMTTPSTVNPERILLVRSVSNAITATSRHSPRLMALLTAKRLDRVE